MQEGESELGGLKIPHGNTTPPSSTPGSQSAASAATKSEPAPSPTPTPNPQPATSPAPQPNPLPVTPPQVSTNPTPTPQPQPAPSPTNHFSNRPVVRQPFPSPIPNSPTQDTTFNNFDNNIILSPAPQPKKSKKWLVITIIFLLTVVGLGVSILLATLLAEPIQQVSKEQYNNLLESQEILTLTSNLLDNGLNNNLSFYSLLYADYLANNNRPLAEAMSSINRWKSDDNDIPYIISYTPESLALLKSTIDSMHKMNYTKEINKKVQEIYNVLPDYSSMITSFIDKISRFKIIFINYDSYDDRKELIDDKEVLYDITDHHIDFLDITSSWDSCIIENNNEICAIKIDQQKARHILENTKTANEIFKIFLNEEEITLIQATNSDISQLINLIEEQDEK